MAMEEDNVPDGAKGVKINLQRNTPDADEGDFLG
jgi:hypothetical protein